MLDFENNLATSTPFVYPDEEEPVEEHHNLNEFLTRLAIVVLSNKNPTLSLVCLFHAAGVNLSFILNCESTEVALAKVLGVPKQTFSLEVKRIRKELSLTHTSTNMTGKTADKYQNNFKRPKSIWLN